MAAQSIVWSDGQQRNGGGASEVVMHREWSTAIFLSIWLSVEILDSDMAAGGGTHSSEKG